MLCSTHDLDNLPALSGYLLNLSEARAAAARLSARHGAGGPRVAGAGAMKLLKD